MSKIYNNKQFQFCGGIPVKRLFCVSALLLSIVVVISGCHLHFPTKRGMILRGDWAIEYNRTPWIGCPPDVDCGDSVDENGSCNQSNCVKCSAKSKLKNFFSPDKKDELACSPQMMYGSNGCMYYVVPGCSPVQCFPGTTTPMHAPVPISGGLPGICAPTGGTSVTPNINGGTPSIAVPDKPSTTVPLTPPVPASVSIGPNGMPINTMPTQMVMTPNGMVPVQAVPGSSPIANGVPGMSGTHVCHHNPVCPAAVNPQTGHYVPLCISQQSAGVTLINPVSGQVVPGLSMSGYPAPGYPPIGYASRGYSPGHAQPVPVGMGGNGYQAYGSIAQAGGAETTGEDAKKDAKTETGSMKSEMPVPRLHAIPTSPVFQRPDGTSAQGVKATNPNRLPKLSGTGNNLSQEQQAYIAQQRYYAQMAVANQTGMQPQIIPAGYSSNQVKNPFSSIVDMFDFSPEEHWQGGSAKVVSSTASQQQLKASPPVINRKTSAKTL